MSKSWHNHNESQGVIQLKYESCLLFVKGLTATQALEYPWLAQSRDPEWFQTHAYYYRDLVRSLFNQGRQFIDHAKGYETLKLDLQTGFQPYDYQQDALEAWLPSKKGVLALPTGSGKTLTAALAIAKINRSTLVLAPTLELIFQWQATLSGWFGQPIGLLGGGSHSIEPITVATYDSAHIYAEKLGNQFCLIVFDECHHLPAPAYSTMARGYLAPFRLGLSATPELEQERAEILSELVGPILFHRQIGQLTGNVLAPYRTETLYVDLDEKERELYDFHRNRYLNFRDQITLQYGPRLGWDRFVLYAYRSKKGRIAIESFHTQKRIATAAKEKMHMIAKLLRTHQNERILIFTNDNKTAYRISTLFLLPLITHETKPKERKVILEHFKQGKWPFLVNSRVLNEGVDVPDANIAIIVSGTATVREHVQRLGRILRGVAGKKALLYELVTDNTGEVYTSRKRRSHKAYEQD